jgi:hypothetical protein
MMNLVTHAIRDLPKPSSANLTPVTFIEFAKSLHRTAIDMKLANEEVSLIDDVLKSRSLLDALELNKDWARVGRGTQAAPGLKIEDDPSSLGAWLRNALRIDPSWIGEQSASGKLAPGKFAMIWFDIENTSERTAGGVLLTVTSEDPDVTFLERPLNLGFMGPSQVQIQYPKINGSGAVRTLGPSYLATSPGIGVRGQGDRATAFFATGIFLHISPTAPHGKKVNFLVHLKPANGPEADLNFDATLE